MAAITMTALAAALEANKADVATAISGTEANVTALAQYLAAAAKYPAARQSVGALIANPELIPE